MWGLYLLWLLASPYELWLFLSQAHGLQLEAFAAAIGKLDAHLPRPKLQFVGSCRNKSDEERLQSLKDKAIELKVDRDVEFHKNVMYRSVLRISYPFMLIKLILLNAYANI